MPGETILIADDEPTVRAYVRNILLAQGFNVVEAVDGVDAIEQVEKRGLEVDLLVTDVRMPGMDGIALARSIGEKHPEIPVLFISGYPFDRDAVGLLSRRECGALGKPFTRKALLGAVEKCLSNPDRVAGQSG